MALLGTSDSQLFQLARAEQIVDISQRQNEATEFSIPESNYDSGEGGSEVRGSLEEITDV